MQVNVRDNFGSICSRRGVDDDSDAFVVDNDDSFLDEGVHVEFSLVDKEFLVCCKERLSCGLVITFRKKRPFVNSVVDRSIVNKYHMTST